MHPKNQGNQTQYSQKITDLCPGYFGFSIYFSVYTGPMFTFQLECETPRVTKRYSVSYDYDRQTNFDADIYAPLYLPLYINTRLLMNQDHEQSVFQVLFKVSQSNLLPLTCHEFNVSESSRSSNENIYTRFSHFASVKYLNFEEAFFGTLKHFFSIWK